MGITGGEPTIAGDALRDLIIRMRNQWPTTALHMLTNGRRFAWREQASAWATLGHPNLTFAIPLYADVPEIHDYIVQARHAFVQTVLGLERMGAWGQRIEIRVVLQQATLPRLERLARFIGRNLPFVSQVSLMGLEVTGFAKTNLRDVWVDPSDPDYQDVLASACETLENAGIHPLILNHQLCVLRPTLWRFSTVSISDWKREYVDCCSDCAVRTQCGGVFATSRGKVSANLRTLSPSDLKRNGTNRAGRS